MYTIRKLAPEDIFPEMLFDFNDHQEITRKWVRSGDGWTLADASECHKWNRDKRVWVAGYLREQIERGGATVAAFDGDTLVGFGSVDGGLDGETAKYANLTMLFVDDSRKRQGVGRAIFGALCVCAAEMGAEKLFISAIPSLETVAFYFSLGCTDAAEIISDFVDTEEDRYLEFTL